MSNPIEPLPNELFSSWLHRQGAIPRIGKLALREVTDVYQRCMQQGDFDPDFDPGSEFTRTCLERIGMSQVDFQCFDTTSSWLIPRYYRGAFCYQCFCEHITNFRLPTMLTEWCYVYHTVCPHHSAPILDTPGRYNYKLNMALKLFGHYHSNPNIVSKEPLGLESGVLSALLAIQSLMSKLEPNFQAGGNFHQWRLIQLIIRVLLYPRHGVITSLFPKQPVSTDSQQFRYNLNLGPLISQVIRRRLAVLLTGLLLDYVDHADRSAAERYLGSYDQRHHFFDNMYGLGRAANIFTPERGRQLLSQLLELAKDIESPYLRDFVAGFGGGRG